MLDSDVLSRIGFCSLPVQSFAVRRDLEGVTHPAAGLTSSDLQHIQCAAGGMLLTVGALLNHVCATKSAAARVGLVDDPTPVVILS